MNSREKGKRGERAWRDELRANGYDARRGQQFSGSPDSPDVSCDALPWLHFEVKCVERLNIEDAMEQARRDACEKLKAEMLKAETERVPIVAHKRRHRRWLVTMEAEAFFRFLRGDFQPPRHEGHEEFQSLVASTPADDGAHGVRRPTPISEGQRSEDRGQIKKSEVFGGSPNTTGGAPVPPQQFLAAACAAATNQNNQSQNQSRDAVECIPTNERTNETESQ